MLANVFCFDDITVNFPSAGVMRGGRSVEFTAKEFKTLKFMIQNAGRVISRHELLKRSPYSDRGYAHPEPAKGTRPSLFIFEPYRVLAINLSRRGKAGAALLKGGAC
jgi:Transcriptional regulatory protein, C terminal